MSWSPQQEAAIKSVSAWLQDKSSQVFYLAGYAGTGKTTLAKELAQDVKGQVLYGAFTGKAALVLQKKGCTNASTIHSMIYKLDENTKGWEPKFVLNPFSRSGRQALSSSMRSRWSVRIWRATSCPTARRFWSSVIRLSFLRSRAPVSSRLESLTSC
jgi:DNA polymerase III delta prime subunit